VQPQREPLRGLACSGAPTPQQRRCNRGSPLLRCLAHRVAKVTCAGVVRASFWPLCSSCTRLSAAALQPRGTFWTSFRVGVGYVFDGGGLGSLTSCLVVYGYLKSVLCSCAATNRLPQRGVQLRGGSQGYYAWLFPDSWRRALLKFALQLRGPGARPCLASKWVVVARLRLLDLCPVWCGPCGVCTPRTLTSRSSWTSWSWFVVFVFSAGGSSFWSRAVVADLLVFAGLCLPWWWWLPLLAAYGGARPLEPDLLKDLARLLPTTALPLPNKPQMLTGLPLPPP
jgi:hypothetical protein